MTKQTAFFTKSTKACSQHINGTKLNESTQLHQCVCKIQSVSVTTYFISTGYRHCSKTRSLSSEHVYSRGNVHTGDCGVIAIDTVVQFCSVSVM